MSGYKKWERPPKIKTEDIITTCIVVPTNKYISAEWLCNELGDINMDIYTDEVKEYIDSAPSINIVHCEECKWRKAKMMPKSVKCLFSGKDDDFCSYGERNTNEN